MKFQNQSEFVSLELCISIKADNTIFLFNGILEYNAQILDFLNLKNSIAINF